MRFLFNFNTLNMGVANPQAICMTLMPVMGILEWQVRI